MKKIDWFCERKWGLFHHYLPHSTEPSAKSGLKAYKSFNDRVNAFDVKNYAKTAHELNAGYVFFTVMQAARYMCAPNDAYNKITGFKPGEACSERDLIADLIEELDKYDIPLFLYIPADGPFRDEEGSKRFGFCESENEGDGITTEFVEKWASVLEEYALRYKDKVHGWWIDGANDYFGFKESHFKAYHDAIKKGNPDALITFNNGIYPFDVDAPEYQKYYGNVTNGARKRKIVEGLAREGVPAAKRIFDKPPVYVYRYSQYEDYTAGEANAFEEYPTQRFVDGSQWHILSFMGVCESESDLWGRNGNWGGFGCEYSGQYMYDYVKKCNSLGGIVTIDAALYDDGHIDWGQYEILKKLGELRK